MFDDESAEPGGGTSRWNPANGLLVVATISIFFALQWYLFVAIFERLAMTLHIHPVWRLVAGLLPVAADFALIRLAGRLMAITRRARYLFIRLLLLLGGLLASGLILIPGGHRGNQVWLFSHVPEAAGFLKVVVLADNSTLLVVLVTGVIVFLTGGRWPVLVLRLRMAVPIILMFWANYSFYYPGEPDGDDPTLAVNSRQLAESQREYWRTLSHPRRVIPTQLGYLLTFGSTMMLHECGDDTIEFPTVHHFVGWQTVSNTGKRLGVVKLATVSQDGHRVLLGGWNCHQLVLYDITEDGELEFAETVPFGEPRFKPLSSVSLGNSEDCHLLLSDHIPLIYQYCFGADKLTTWLDLSANLAEQGNLYFNAAVEDGIVALGKGEPGGGRLEMRTADRAQLVASRKLDFQIGAIIIQNGRVIVSDFFGSKIHSYDFPNLSSPDQYAGLLSVRRLLEYGDQLVAVSYGTGDIAIGSPGSLEIIGNAGPKPLDGLIANNRLLVFSAHGLRSIGLPQQNSGRVH